MFDHRYNVPEILFQGSHPFGKVAASPYLPLHRFVPVLLYDKFVLQEISWFIVQEAIYNTGCNSTTDSSIEVPEHIQTITGVLNLVPVQ